MRTIILSFLFVGLFILSGTSQVIDTVLADYEWEQPNLPNDPTLSLARTDNRLFAGTVNGLFYSEDDGEKWTSIPELYANDIESVVTEGNTVIATYKKLTQSIPGSGSTITYFNWISKDEGVTIDTVLRLWDQSGTGFSQEASLPYIFSENSFGQFLSTGTWGYSYANFYLWTETNGDWNVTESNVSTDSFYIVRPLSAGVEDAQPYYNVRRTEFLLRHFFDENTGTLLSIDTIDLGRADSHFSGDTIRYSTNNSVNLSTDYGESFSTITYPQFDPFTTQSFFDESEIRYYFQAGDTIYRQNENDALLLDTIFTPLQTPGHNEDTYFFIDENYLWVHSSGRLYRSEKANISWVAKDKGIANVSFISLGNQGFKIGNELWVSRSGSEGIYVMSDDNAEPLYLDTELLDIQRPTTKIGDRYLRAIDGEWHWSLDAIDYQSYGIPSQPNSPRVKQINGTYYLVENDRVLFTNDEAETFDSISIPIKGELFVKGDTLAIFENNAFRHLSSDAGNSWTSEEIAYPFGLNIQTKFIHYYNDTLYLFHDFNSFYFSTDWGASWTDPTPGEWLYFFHFNPIIDNSVVAVKDSLVLAHIQGDLWATTNFGESWTILDDVPFSVESYLLNINFQYNYYHLNGALKYHIADDNIYAFTRDYGVQRTPIADLLAAMAPPTYTDLELSANGPLDYKIYEPIPYQIVVANRGSTDATDVIIRAPLPDGVVYTSDITTSGVYNLYYEEWTIDSLPAGAKDTLQLTLFPLLNDSEITFFTQIVNAEAELEDWDSTPNNNALEEAPAEDDEAVVVSVPNVSFSLKSSTSSGLALYPNPANDVLFLQLQEGGFYDLQMISVDGTIKKSVKMELTQNSVTEFKIDDLPKGSYFLFGQDRERKFTLPFVKE